MVVALTSTIHPSGLVDGAGKAGGGPRLRPAGKEGEGVWGGVRGNGAVGLGENEGGGGPSSTHATGMQSQSKQTHLQILGALLPLRISLVP